jgi:hypothetical protein
VSAVPPVQIGCRLGGATPARPGWPRIGGYRVRMPLSDRPAAPSRAARDRRHRLVVLLAVTAALLAGCVSPKNQAAGPTPGATSQAPTGEATGDLARFYGQQLEWTT